MARACVRFGPRRWLCEFFASDFDPVDQFTQQLRHVVGTAAVDGDIDMFTNGAQPKGTRH
jgi:hypothetical protein